MEPVAGPQAARADTRRHRYLLAVLVALVGVTAAGLWAVTGFLDQVQRPEEFARTEVPGVMSVEIGQAGSHVIYLEGTEPAPFAAADLTVLDPQGVPVGVHPYSLDLRYDVPGEPGRLGTAIARFDADRTGTYQVGAQTGMADADVPESGARMTLAVGDDLAPGVLRTVAVPTVIGVLALLAGIGLALATWIDDERRKQS
ncbi:MAG: hypothetical protein WCF36_10190 [Candidatus Nanopelagicales bacterium]